MSWQVVFIQPTQMYKTYQNTILLALVMKSVHPEFAMFHIINGVTKLHPVFLRLVHLQQRGCFPFGGKTRKITKKYFHVPSDLALSPWERFWFISVSLVSTYGTNQRGWGRFYKHVIFLKTLGPPCAKNKFSKYAGVASPAQKIQHQYGTKK